MAACLIGIACVMMVQVCVRKIPFLRPLEWAEEFCRFLWVMSVFMSLPYTIRKGKMLCVNFLLDLVPEAARRVFRLCIDAVTAGSMGLLAVYSVGVFRKIAASRELSPAMLWPMTWVYIFLVAGFFLGVFRSIQMFVIHILRFHDRVATAVEQTKADAAREAGAGRRAEGA